MEIVLITGASSGIGKDLAYEFSKKGYNLLLVSRREELLKELKEELVNEYDIYVDYYACDLVKDSKKLYEYCHQKEYEVTGLVNNAGYGDYGSFIDGDIDKLLGIIDLNNKTLVSLTYYFVKGMKEKGRGNILNVGSVASLIPGPYMAVYYASKAFVMSFSMGLRQELKPYNIKVSVLCPAPTRSDFWKVANGETSSVYDNILARSTKDAAKTGIHLYESNKPYAIDGIPYKIMIAFSRHLPLNLCAKIIGNLQKKTKS